ncbi:MULTISPECIES: sensor histidine kinase [unclassified Streptomyces]|uniref:sensor histidine kinase n=1 Tax=unclassified Streptomyces TaxID=2593676 RepID=UPI003866AD62|nr:histidine kinase [Streptomyces sp. NBC_00827]
MMTMRLTRLWASALGAAAHPQRQGGAAGSRLRCGHACRKGRHGWAQRHLASAEQRTHPDGNQDAGPPEADAGWPKGDAGYLADDAPAPGSIRLQLNALQALCRQAFAVRGAAIAIGAPVAIANATDGPPRYAVLAAAVLGVMGSYAMLRDWDRFGPRLLAHPTLMAVDLTFGAVLLLTASPASPLAYATVCTPLLAGLLYGWRGSGIFTGLQLIVLLTVYRAWAHHPGAGANTLLIAGFCIGAGIIGVTLRNLMFRFGTASQALSEATSRLAVAEAVESERARLAREMHDSVAKTLHGLALAAEALAASADASDPKALEALKGQATTVAGAARRAAAESRALLSDLRSHTDLLSELTIRTADFESHTQISTSLNHKGGRCPPLPDTTAHHLLAIVSEALENAHRHADAKRVTIELEASETDLTVRVQDDGRGLPGATTLQDATKTGHFGLLGMAERAATLNARIHLGRSPQGGTEVAVTLPLALPATPCAPHPPQQEAAHA